MRRKWFTVAKLNNKTKTFHVTQMVSLSICACPDLQGTFGVSAKNTADSYYPFYLV